MTNITLVGTFGWFGTNQSLTSVGMFGWFVEPIVVTGETAFAGAAFIISSDWGVAN